MTLPPPYEIDCHAVASELREAMTKTETVSDAKVAQLITSYQHERSAHGPDTIGFERADELVTVLHELLSRRAANSAGGVEKARSNDQFQVVGDAFLGAIGRSSPAVEAEPVAHPLDDIAGPAARRLFQYTRTFNAIAAATTQNAVGIGISVRAFIKAFGPIDLDILPYTHPSSPVSAEVMEEVVETVAMTMHDHRKATDSLWTLWEDMPEDYRQTSLAMVRAGLAALSGGRENG